MKVQGTKSPKRKKQGQASTLHDPENVEPDERTNEPEEPEPQITYEDLRTANILRNQRVLQQIREEEGSPLSTIIFSDKVGLGPSAEVASEEATIGAPLPSISFISK
jgi:hypothetical protein